MPQEWNCEYRVSAGNHLSILSRLVATQAVVVMQYLRARCRHSCSVLSGNPHASAQLLKTMLSGGGILANYNPCGSQSNVTLKQAVPEQIASVNSRHQQQVTTLVQLSLVRIHGIKGYAFGTEIKSSLWYTDQFASELFRQRRSLVLDCTRPTSCVDT